MDEATSDVFRCAPRDYMRSLAIAWLSVRWPWFAVPLLAAVVWSFFDLRAVYVCLIMIFIVYPMALSFVWFNYAFSEQSRRAVSPKTVTCSKQGLRIDYKPIAEGLSPLPAQTLDWASVRSVETSSRGTTLVIGSRLDDRLSIPADAFDAESWQFFNSLLPSSAGAIDEF